MKRFKGPTSYEDCQVAGQFCKGATRASCFSCGVAVCVMCSTRRKFLDLGRDYGRVRLCDDCQERYDGNDKIVVRRYARRFK